MCLAPGVWLSVHSVSVLWRLDNIGLIVGWHCRCRTINCAAISPWNDKRYFSSCQPAMITRGSSSNMLRYHSTRDVDAMLVHRLRCLPNNKPALRQCLVFTELLAHTAKCIYWPVIYTFCDCHMLHVSGRCLDSIATYYYNTAGPRTGLWEVRQVM